MKTGLIVRWINEKPWLFLLAVLVIATALRMIFFVGCIASDDMSVWARAVEIAGGNWGYPTQTLNRFSSLRFGLIIPLVGIFKVFGTGESAAMSFSLFMSLLGIAAVWDLVRLLTRSLVLATLGALWVSLGDLDIAMATVILPDGPMASAVLLSAWAWVRFEFSGSRRQKIVFALLAGFASGFAISVKEAGGTIALIASGAWMLILLLSRQFSPSHLWFIPGFTAAMGLDLLVSAIIYDDVLFRWKKVFFLMSIVREDLIESGVRSEKSLVANNFLDTIGRLWRESPLSLVGMLGAIGALTMVVRKTLLNDRAKLFICVLGVLLFAARVPEAYFTFSYQPRRILPLVNLMPVLVSLVLVQAGALRFTKRLWIPLIICMLGLVFAYPVYSLMAKGGSASLRRYSNLTNPERSILSWLEIQMNNVKDGPIYFDHRTLRTLGFLGRGRLDALQLTTYPAIGYDNNAGVIVPPKPPLYTPTLAEPNDPGVIDLGRLETGYFVLNPKILIFLGRQPRLNWFKNYAYDIPERWELVGITTRSGMAADDGVLIYRITDQNATDQTYFGSHLAFNSQEAGWTPKPLDTDSSGALVVKKSTSSGATFRSRRIAWGELDSALPALSALNEAFTFENRTNIEKAPKSSSVRILVYEYWDGSTKAGKSRADKQMAALSYSGATRLSGDKRIIAMKRRRDSTGFYVKAEIKGVGQFRISPPAFRIPKLSTLTPDKAK